MGEESTRTDGIEGIEDKEPEEHEQYDFTWRSQPAEKEPVNECHGNCR